MPNFDFTTLTAGDSLTDIDPNFQPTAAADICQIASANNGLLGTTGTQQSVYYVGGIQSDTQESEIVRNIVGSTTFTRSISMGLPTLQNGNYTIRFTRSGDDYTAVELQDSGVRVGSAQSLTAFNYLSADQNIRLSMAPDGASGYDFTIVISAVGVAEQTVIVNQASGVTLGGRAGTTVGTDSSNIYIKSFDNGVANPAEITSADNLGDGAQNQGVSGERMDVVTTLTIDGVDYSAGIDASATTAARLEYDDANFDPVNACTVAKYGDVLLEITEPNGSDNTTITRTPLAGWSYANLNTISTSNSSLANLVPGIAVGDQPLMQTQSNESPSVTGAILSNGEISVTGAQPSTTYTFNWRVLDITDNNLSAVSTLSVTDGDVTTPAQSPYDQAISSVDIPNAYTFSIQSGVPRSVIRTSNAVTFPELTESATVTSNGTILINGSIQASPAILAVGQSLALRHTSSGAYSAPVTTVVTVNGVAATFQSVTEADLGGPSTGRKSFAWPM